MILKEIDKRVLALADITKNQKIFDLGCGNNKYKEYFKNNNEFIGIDIEESGRSIDDKKPDIFYDGKKIPFDNDSFDLIICIEVLEHVENFNLIIEEIYRSLKKGGRAVVTMPFITAEHELPYDFRRLTSFGIKREFEKIGFKVKKFEKILYGHAAIRQLIYGEMNRFEGQNKVNIFFKFLVKSIFRLAFRILGLFYKFDRVYFTNYLEIEKINI